MKEQKSAKFPAPLGQRMLGVERLPELADRLSAAIGTLATWKIRVADLGRLRSAEATLRSTHHAAAYPDDEPMLRNLAEAMWIASDFPLIVNALEPALSRRVASELQTALRGTLHATEPTRAPYQFQTQFRFGAAMHRGGLAPTIPPDRQRNPDFRVCPCTLPYGVEVKRPVSKRGALDAVKTARDQLVSANLHGVVILDLTDVLDEIGLRRFTESAEDQPYDELKQAYRSLTDELIELAWDSKRRLYRPGFASIMAMWFTARGWRWVKDSLESPQLFEMQGMQRITSARGNVWHFRAEEFFAMLVSGLQQAGWVIRETEQEADDPIAKPFWEQWPILSNAPGS